MPLAGQCDESKYFFDTAGWARLTKKYFDVSRFSSAESGQKPSYIHRLGTAPLRFETIGQALKKTATKHPDRLALVSHSEGAQITYAETLDRVIKIN